jgi:hypothetical protein
MSASYASPERSFTRMERQMSPDGQWQDVLARYAKVSFSTVDGATVATVLPFTVRTTVYQFLARVCTHVAAKFAVQMDPNRLALAIRVPLPHSLIPSQTVVLRPVDVLYEVPYVRQLSDRRLDACFHLRPVDVLPDPASETDDGTLWLLNPLADPGNPDPEAGVAQLVAEHAVATDGALRQLKERVATLEGAHDRLQAECLALRATVEQERAAHRRDIHRMELLVAAAVQKLGERPPAVPHREGVRADPGGSGGGDRLSHPLLFQ